jgi:hypothetical protein
MARVKDAWIAALTSSDEGVRAAGASAIYAAGRSSADLILERWSKEEEFAQLVGKDPVVTVGLAVWPATFAKIREANGWPRLAEVPAEQDASEFELHFAGNIALDVLTSRDPQGSGAIAKFIGKFGQDVQQVEFRCSNVDRGTTILRERFGVTSVYPETRPGADGTRINFFLVTRSSGEKILIELYEPGATRFE